MEKLKMAVNASEEILGFNPKTTVEHIFKVFMTPEMARYILKHHNKSNRKFVQAQRNAIAKSIAEEGWLHTGDTCAFDENGNLTEFQHRLEDIAEGNETRVVWVATGVKPDTFINAAPPKNRTKWDAVYKTDNTATKDEVTTLEQILKRRKGDTLTMVNAPEEFAKWADFVRKGMASTNDFFDMFFTETIYCLF